MNCINDSRREQFHQLKKEIRGSEKHLIIGIDAAKEKHNAFFGTARGQTLVKNLVFNNTLEGFQKLLANGERIKVQYSLTAIVFGIE
jgi:transposase